MTTTPTCECGHPTWEHDMDKSPLAGWPCIDSDCDCTDYEPAANEALEIPDHDTRGSEGHDLDPNLERRLRLRGHLPPASDPFAGLDIPTNDGWDAS